MIERMDASLGRIQEELRRWNLEEKTIVIFTSDNGGFGKVTSNAPLRGSKGMLYEGGVRVPMAIYWPGVTRPGSVSQEPVISLDLYPTILEMAGAKIPKEYSLDGQSLVPLLAQTQCRLERKALYWHFPAYLQSNGVVKGSPFRTTPAGSIRMGDWKLIEFFEDGRKELYNLQDDVGETTNLASRHPGKADELYQALVAWRKEVDAPVPTELNPLWRP